MSKPKPDWETIREGYVCGLLGFRPLSEKHGVLFSTLAKRAKREEWHRLRREFRSTHPLKPVRPSFMDRPAFVVPVQTVVPAEKLLGHLEKLGARLEAELEKVAGVELTPKNLKMIGELGKVLRSLVAAKIDLRNASQVDRPGQRRLFRPEVLAQATRHAMELAPFLSIQNPKAEPVKEP